MVADGFAQQGGLFSKMQTIQKLRLALLACAAGVALAGGLASPVIAADDANIQVAAQARTPARPARLTPEQERQLLLQRLQQLETRLNQVESQRGMPATPP